MSNRLYTLQRAVDIVSIQKKLHSIQLTSAYFRYKYEYISGIHILHGLLHTARTGSVYVTIAVTIERYFAVVHPIKEFNMKVLLLPIAIIFAVLYNIPKVILD